jgi:hypothetical protein
MRRINILLGVAVAALWFVSASYTSAIQVTEMKPTVYDDGKSCPGDCDAHVVFSPVHNGTRNAYDPASSRNEPRKCAPGQKCMVCFSAPDSSCVAVTYRGAGPPQGKFDFTPAFFEENCGRTDLPAPLAQICRAANPAVEKLKTRSLNCFQNPEHPKCEELMERVIRRKAADDVLYDECQRLGEAAFNRKHRRNPAMQRINDCKYEKLRRGLNPRTGVRWHLLLDGACRPGTYAGRSGLDCCSGNLYQTALLGSECNLFFK